jgi:hypothetical protein
VQLFPLCEEDWRKRQVLVQQDGQTTEKTGGGDAG